MPNERREYERLDDVQTNKPGSREELREMRNMSREMVKIFPNYPDPEKSNVVRIRRDVYESLGNS